MGPEQEDQWLDSLLAGEQEETPDSGFTTRVLAALPPRRSPARRRFWILGASALLAGLICFLILPAGRFVWETLERTAYLQVSMGSVIVILSLVGTVMWGAFTSLRQN